MDVTEQLDQDQDREQGEAEDQASKGSADTSDGEPLADDFSNLSDTRISQLRSVCNAMDKRDEWARMIELIRATLRRYFKIGQQHPYWNADAGQFQVGPSGVTLGDEDENFEEFFEEEFNIYAGFHDVFVSVFSQTAAPTHVEASNLSGEAVKAAKEAEKYVTVYEHFNPPKCAQREVGTLMWTDGRIIAVTDFEENEELCGTDEDGKILGAEFTRYYGVLEAKVPIVEPYLKWPYARVDCEIDILLAKDENPKIASKIEAQAKGQIPNNEIARMSRIAVAEGIAQVSADTLANLVTQTYYWLRPSAFQFLDETERTFWIGGTTKDDQENETKVEGVCPKGLRVKWVGTVFAGGKVFKVKGEPVSALDAQVKVLHTHPGTGNARGSKSDAIIPIQMEFNDAMGMLSEMYHKCIPHTLANTDETSLAAINEQFSRFGEWAAMESKNGLPLADNIFQETQIDVPASFALWMENLQGALPQQVANIQPAMFGGNMEDQKTAKAYAQAKDMSLGVMALTWVPYLEFKAGVAWQAARLAAAREQKKISVSIPQKRGRSKVVSIDTGVLGRGGFLCKARTDQNFPESHTDVANKWGAIYQAAEQNPNGISAQLFKEEPDNLVAFRDATGIEIVIRGAAARDKQLAEWELMCQEDGPVPDVQGAAEQTAANQQTAQAVLDQAAPGSQAPPVPAVPPEETSSVQVMVADDDIEEARTCVRILNDTKTIEMRDKQPEVVRDLELHLGLHLKAAIKAGLVLPPDLVGAASKLGVLPPPPAAGAAPGTPGAPAAAPPVPPIAKPKPAALPIAAAAPIGGNNAAITT